MDEPEMMLFTSLHQFKVSIFFLALRWEFAENGYAN